MLVLLPPSEGKAAPSGGDPVDLDALVHPTLRPIRERTLEAVARLCRGDLDTALAVLGLGPRSAGEVARGRDLTAAPAAPAAVVYTGVLFGRLGLRTLPPAARRRAEERVLITSALWGVLRPGDRVPAYRLSAGVRLAGVPAAGPRWRGPLAAVLPDDQLVVDLRSGPYRALWRPAHAPSVGVAVARDRDGARSSVSHMAKATRGAVARALLRDRRRDPVCADEVADRIARAGWEVELGDPDRAGRVRLTVLERDDPGPPDRPR